MEHEYESKEETEGFSVAQSTVLNARKRLMALREMTIDRSKRSKIQVGTSSKVAAMSAVADSCYMIVTHAKKKKATANAKPPNPNAPKSFNGILYNVNPEKTDTEFIHTMHQFETAWAGDREVKQRESWRIPNGTIVNSVSTFEVHSPVALTEDNGRRALVELQCVSFSVQPQTEKALEKEEEDPFTKLKTKLILRDVGDPYISLNAACVKFIRWATYEDLNRVSSSCYHGPAQDIPRHLFIPSMNYPTGLERRDVDYIPGASQTKAKSKRFLNTLDPWSISTDILRSRMYPEFYTILEIRNDTNIYGTENYTVFEGFETPLPVTAIVPGEDDKEFMVEQRGTEPTIYDATWRNEKGKDVTVTTLDIKRPLGKIGLFFSGKNCVSEFGIFSHTHWKKVAAQLIRGMRGMVLLSLDLNKVSEPDDQVDYTARGFADIVYLNAPTTFKYAGLKVSLQFAERTIKETLNLKSLKSEFSSRNENIVKFTNEATKEQVDCFCINEYTGSDLHELVTDEYDVYCVPFSSRCTITDSCVALQRQQYWIKNDAEDCIDANEKFIEDERWIPQCLFFVVKKAASTEQSSLSV